MARVAVDRSLPFICVIHRAIIHVAFHWLRLYLYNLVEPVPFHSTQNVFTEYVVRSMKP